MGFIVDQNIVMWHITVLFLITLDRLEFSVIS
jgi:hypothetical protein